MTELLCGALHNVQPSGLVQLTVVFCWYTLYCWPKRSAILLADLHQTFGADFSASCIVVWWGLQLTGARCPTRGAAQTILAEHFYCTEKAWHCNSRAWLRRRDITILRGPRVVLTISLKHLPRCFKCHVEKTSFPCKTCSPQRATYWAVLLCATHQHPSDGEVRIMHHSFGLNV